MLKSWRKGADLCDVNISKMYGNRKPERECEQMLIAVYTRYTFRRRYVDENGYDKKLKGGSQRTTVRC